MSKILKSKKMKLLVTTAAVVACMGAQAFAASLTTVEIWTPATPYQATSPNTVYMDYDDTSNWTTTGEHVEKFAWRFFDSSNNPDITTAGDCSAQVYVNNNDSNALAYSYDFDAGDINQDLIKVQPYYLGIKVDSYGSYDYVDMGCRDVFPAPMTVKIPTNMGANQSVTVAYVSGSCDGYVKCAAHSWSEIQGTGGSANYLSNHPNSGDFSIFSSYTTTTDANGYVTFTTDHGGEYYIY